ncbi:MAG: YihY/virulence factor BrkB family protein [Clostridia bacterium]|nr:YihY/virulence factor BrkB family protein [Clostridia bacterium]
MIYGTLGAVIVLLIWLYMTALVLILGAEFNAALMVARREVEELYAEKQVNLS